MDAVGDLLQERTNWVAAHEGLKMAGIAWLFNIAGEGIAGKEKKELEPNDHPITGIRTESKATDFV